MLTDGRRRTKSDDNSSHGLKEARWAKNGVGLYNIFFNFYTKLAESSFQKTILHMRKHFTEWGHSVGHQWSYDDIHEYMNIMQVNIECFTGCKRIKQRRISFVPGYLLGM
jgi:hypothetical protein